MTKVDEGFQAALDRINEHVTELRANKNPGRVTMFFMCSTETGEYDVNENYVGNAGSALVLLGRATRSVEKYLDEGTVIKFSFAKMDRDA